MSSATRLFLDELTRTVEAPDPIRGQQWLAMLRRWSEVDDQPVTRWASRLLSWSESSRCCRAFKRVRGERREIHEWASTGTFIAASSAKGVARATCLAPDLELMVERSAAELRVRSRQFADQRLIRRDYRASSVAELKDAHPSAYALLCRWGGNSGGVRSGGQWFDLEDLIDREQWDRQRDGWVGRHRGAVSIEAEFAFIDLIDEIDTALSIASVDDLKRWHFRCFAQRIREFARPRRERGEESEVDVLARRTGLNLMIAEIAVQEIAEDLPQRERLCAILAERRSEFEAIVDRARRQVFAEDDDPYDGPPDVPSYLREGLRELEQNLRISLHQEIEPTTLAQFTARSESIRILVGALSRRWQSWMEWFATWLPLESAQRVSIEGEARSALDSDGPETDVEMTALRLRAAIRRILDGEQLAKWDRATIHPPVRFVTETQIRTTLEKLEAIDECEFDATTAVALRAMLEKHVESLRDLDAGNPNIGDVEFIQLSAPLLLGFKKDWMQFPPEVPQALSRRMDVIVRQSAVFRRVGSLPLTPPVALRPEQLEMFHRLAEECEREQKAHQDSISFGIGNVQRQLSMDRAPLGDARRRFRSVLSPEQVSQWDKQTTELLHAQRAQAELAQAKAAQPCRIPFETARLYTCVHSVEVYEEAAHEAELSNDQRRLILLEVASLRERLEQLAREASEVPTDMQQLQERSKAELAGVRSLAERAAGKSAADAWLARVTLIHWQVRAVQMASFGQVHLAKQWLEKAGLAERYGDLVRCCREAGTLKILKVDAAVGAWRAALRARRQFLMSLAAANRRALDDATEVIKQ